MVKKTGKTRIFLAVGTHPQQFNRLVKKMDEIASAKKSEYDIFGQTGHSDYVPKNFRHKAFLGISEFEEKIGWADIVIMHAGAGTFGKCSRAGKIIIVVPRLKEFGEHNDSHQVELAHAIGEKGLGIVAESMAELEEKTANAENLRLKKLEKGRIGEIIRDFLEK